MKRLASRIGLFVVFSIVLMGYPSWMAVAIELDTATLSPVTDARGSADSIDFAPDSVAVAGEGLESQRDYSRRVESGSVGSSKLSVDSRWRLFCDSLQQGWVALAAMLLPGSGQVINRDYWKIPIFYGGIAGFSYGAYYFDTELKAIERIELPADPLEALRHEDRRLKTQMARNAMIAGASITYAVSVADALICHSPDYQSPTAAMLSSALLPGLGQIYNRSFWKLPLIYGGLGYLISTALFNHQQFMRYERAYVAIADEDPSTIDEFNGKIPLQTLEYGSNFYRRYRDLSIIGIVLVYALNVIDAYVDAHLFYWNVDDDIEVRTEPQLAMLDPRNGRGMVPSMRVSISF